MTDLLKRVEPFLNRCGSCDAGLPMSCTCPTSDYRPVMLDLVREVERLRTELDAVTVARETLTEENRQP